MTTARDLARGAANEPDSESGLQAIHPLLVAIGRAPLDPISDEQIAKLEEIMHTADDWISHEEFVSEIDAGQTP